MEKRSILVLFSPNYVEAGIAAYKSAAPELPLHIVAYGEEVEYILSNKKIPFESGQAYRIKDKSSIVKYAEQYVQELLTSTAWNFFTYRGIPLQKIFALPLQTFLSQFLYSYEILTMVFNAHPDCTFYIPAPVLPRENLSLGEFELLCFARSAELLCKERNLVFHPIPVPIPQMHYRPPSLGIRAAANLFFCISSAIMRLFAPRSIRILASDYWRNISQLLPALPDAEIVFLDRSEASNAGIWNIWKYRMQFSHPKQYIRKFERNKACQGSFRLNEEWWKVRSVIMPLVWQGHDCTEVMKETLDNFFTRNVTEALELIEASHSMLKRVKPDVLLLRTTVGRQIHFPILALVAASLKVPALELQHGIEHMGRGSFSAKNHSAQYMAIYGQLVQNDMIREGYERKALPAVGSPRFDGYEKVLKTPHDGYVVVCVVPTITYPVLWDTYDVRDYFVSIGDAVRSIPNCRVIAKLRQNQYPRDFFLRAISDGLQGVTYRLAEFEPAPILFAQADAIVSCHSTLILEAMQFGIPPVLWALSPQERMIAEAHYLPYEKDEALAIARDTSELKKQIAILADEHSRIVQEKRTKEFLSHYFSFDGKGAERTAGVIRRLARCQLPVDLLRGKENNSTINV